MSSFTVFHKDMNNYEHEYINFRHFSNEHAERILTFSDVYFSRQLTGVLFNQHTTYHRLENEFLARLRFLCLHCTVSTQYPTFPIAQYFPK